MNTKQLNASALYNSAKELIERLATKKSIKSVVTEWNVCVMQSGADFLTFDFPVEGWTRKAQVVAELERVMVQLTNIMEGREALENETLTVCEAEQATQTINDSTNEALNMVATTTFGALTVGQIFSFYDGMSTIQARKDVTTVPNCNAVTMDGEGAYSLIDEEPVFVEAGAAITTLTADAKALARFFLQLPVHSQSAFITLMENTCTPEFILAFREQTVALCDANGFYQA
ncbi:MULTISPECIES: hypothetical protein [unclassified Enterobacter cloacae complex]|uniref:hypothetical protein n=1 Tax=Enterobacter cloacae complex TaxID=354276 RepID=UPI001872667B|nr:MULTISPECIES: hypothetical protein [unclassified Enterobacter cloacae complex]MBE4887274.1 hypothetical protein [Enterobacter cloacae complex sp. P37RS]MBE7431531.1 hypothetical protein [Enterobacter cloacae complex sp. P36RS]MCE1476578.1 hypothetical protein [Enterobacter hormaechei]